MYPKQFLNKFKRLFGLFNIIRPISRFHKQAIRKAIHAKKETTAVNLNPKHYAKAVRNGG
jgi:hypothetical protein